MVLLSDKSRLKKFFFLTALSVFFSLWTFLLSAPLLRVLRKSFGPAVYWIVGGLFTTVLVILKMYPTAVVVSSFWMTLGAYNEFEQRGLSWRWSGPLSVTLGSLVALGGGWYAVHRTGLNLLEQLAVVAQNAVNSMKQINPKLEIDPNMLVQSIPAALISLLIIALGFGLIFESRVFHWMSLPRERVASQLKLLEFRVPEYYIWIALLGFLFSFENFGIDWLGPLGMNVTIISFVLYFFQGLSVLEVILVVLKAGFFTRAFSYFAFIMQLPILLSLVGFTDYWLDIRGRLRRLRISKSH